MIGSEEDLKRAVDDLAARVAKTVEEIGGEHRLVALHLLAGNLQERLIPNELGETYLSRFRIYGWMPGDKTHFPTAAYLHQFHLPDRDRSPHNHPWLWARSVVLAGGYVERRLHVETGQEQTFVRRPGDVVELDHSTYHVVDQLLGRETWSLFIAGPKKSAHAADEGSWGFWIDGRGHVPWRVRFRERGIPIPY